MNDLVTGFGPYFPPAVILLQLIVWMRTELLIARFRFWAVERFQTKRGYVGK